MDRENHSAPGALSSNLSALARRLGNPFGTIKPVYFSNSAQGIGTGLNANEPPSADGRKIAQTAIQSIGMSTKNPYCSLAGQPKYALAVSLLFTRATHQRIMLGTEPGQVLSTSLLYNSLLHDNRFMQVPLSQAAPGDIIIEPTKNQADRYAGIVVDHGRLVSNSSNGVQNNSSLVEIQRNLPPMVLFRYIGVQKYPGYTFTSLANAGFNPDESRLPAGQSGGGQWTSGGVNGKARAPQFALGGRQIQNDPAKSAPQTTPEAEALKTLWAAVLEAINAGGQHPTSAQLEQFSEAVNALLKYLVDHGMTQEEAFEAVNNAVRNFAHPGAGPNPGSEAVLGTYLGKPAGADIAQIFAGVIIGRSNVPNKNSNAKPPDVGADTQILGKETSKPTVLKPYSEDGGHHVPAKKAFEGDPAYNPNEVLAIPNAELEALGLRHSTITGAQNTLYSAYAKLGKPLTWEAVESIETQALVKSGLDPGRAAATVRETIKALIASGVKEPTRIPWGEK